MERRERSGVKEIDDGFVSLGKEVKKAAGGGKLILFAEGEKALEGAAAALGVEGFTVLKTQVNGKTLSRYSVLNEKEYPECVSAVVGVGSAAAMECAKAFKKSRALTCFLFPTDLGGMNALSDEAYFFTSGGLASFSAPVRTILLDKKMLAASRSGAKGIGAFFAHFTGVLDGAYERLLKRGESPAAALAALRSSALKLSDITEENASEKVYDAIEELALTVKEKNLFRNPSAETLAALLAKDDSRGYPSALFLSSYALLRLYAFYWGEVPLDRALPPDRVKNIELLSSCGVSASALLGRVNERYAEDAEERRALTAEYKEDFLKVIEEGVLPLSASCRAYRRLLKKEGGEIPLSSERILAFVSLTGELVSGYPLIKHIKTTGLIEPLLLRLTPKKDER